MNTIVTAVLIMAVGMPLCDLQTAHAGKGKPPAKKVAGKKAAGKQTKGKSPKKGAKAAAKPAAKNSRASAKRGTKDRQAQAKNSKNSTGRKNGRNRARTTPRAPEAAPRISQRALPKPLEEQIIADTTYVEELADGIAHRWVKTQAKQVVNVITISLASGARLRTVKALDRYDGLRNARDIGIDAFQRAGDTVFAAANASFWRAGSNSPIGPTIAAGEVLEMPGYKQWSSLMVFTDGTAAINRITLEGEVFWRDRRFQVGAVNRRSSTEGIVVYNRHYGDSIPLGSRKSDSAIIAEAYANRVLSESGDDTEGNQIDTAWVVRSYRDSKQLEDREHSKLKLAVVPLKPKRKRDPLPSPMVGDTMRLVVQEIDTGVVAIPENGYVLSLGIQAEWFSVVQKGDTIGLLYTITPKPAKKVRDVVTGTPRLVRDGIADPEHETEGSKARRFVDGKLARTAVGISRDGDTLMIATVNSGCTCTETHGMSLAQFAAFMKSIGAYQALNFDGGGSASMAINGEMISRQGSGPSTRRVSNALLAVRPLKPKKVAARQTSRQPVLDE